MLLGLGNFFPKLAQAKTLPQENFKMLVFADSQCVDYAVWKKIADSAIEQFPDAKLATVIGDLVDNGAADYQWSAWFASAENLLRNRIFLPVIGNHECYNLQWKNCLPEGYLRRFEVPANGENNFVGHFYSYDFGAATFFVLNNNFPELNEILPELQQTQENWLRRAVENSNRTWKIVLMHQDIYNYAADKFENIGEIFIPLFNELKIDLVLTGHLHTYRNRGKIGNATYILCGRAGDQIYIENNSAIDIVTAPDLKTEPETFLAIEVSEKILIAQCLTADGEIFDKFTLQKS